MDTTFLAIYIKDLKKIMLLFDLVILHLVSYPKEIISNAKTYKHRQDVYFSNPVLILGKFFINHWLAIW